MNKGFLIQLVSYALLGSISALAVPTIQSTQAQPVQPNPNRQLDGPESAVANLHRTIQNLDFDSLENYYCEIEKVAAQQVIDFFDPDGESTSLFDAYLQLASGIYTIDMSQLYYETKYYDPELERAVVAVTGNVIITSNDDQSIVLPYRNFSFMGRDWFRLIKENNEWKLCYNLENTPTSTVGSSGNGSQYTFNTNSYIDTGIAVNRGDKLIIQAGGSIRFGLFAGSGGPTGISFNPIYNHFVDLPHGYLIGRVRQPGMQNLEGWFAVGEGTEIVAEGSGVLEFAVNDNNPDDNAGSFQVNVTIDASSN